jgi:hypothetical protein
MRLGWTHASGQAGSGSKLGSNLNQKLYHGIIFARFDRIDAARFPLVALLKKNRFRPKKTGVGALLERLRKVKTGLVNMVLENQKQKLT